MKKLRALIVEDSEDDVLILLRHLKSGGYEVEYQRVETADSMKESLALNDWQLVLSDYSMPLFNGLKALNLLKESGIDIPFIMISGTIGEDTAVQAMLAGVDDYFIKDNLKRLVPAIEREIKESENRRARRQAEKALEEHKKRLQIALSTAGMGVWEWNLQTDDVYWSRECYEIFGSTEFDGKFDEFVKRVHPEDAFGVLKTVKTAVRKRKNFKTEFRAIKENGDVIWLENYGLSEYDHDDKPLKFIGTVQDITERKKSEEALRISEENMRALIQASTQYVWSANKEGISHEMFLWFSKKSGRGIKSVDELIELIHPEDRENVVIAWYEGLENKTVFEMTIRFLAETGEYFSMASRAIPMFNGDGSFRQWVGTCNDITERIKAEEFLRKSEKRFRSLINASSQIVLTANAEGEITTAVLQSKQNLKLSQKGLTEQLIARLHPDEKFRVLKSFLSSIKVKKEYAGEFRIKQDDGTYHFYFSRSTPIYEEDGSISEWVGTLTDITPAKLSEENLRKSEEQLRQAQKLESVGRLAGGIAHDFNNMLTAINGYSDLALRRLNNDDPLRLNLEEIKKAGERSAALTQQLLAFSRSTILQMQILDINQIVNESTVMYKRLIGEDIQIVVDLDPHVDKIKADAGQLSQMLLNLVVNSRDAMPKGGTITIKTDNVLLDENFISQNADAKKGKYVILSVSDTGVGIDEETRKMIFEPFFTTKEIGKGTGLGLSTVYGIINQLGGCINVKSMVGTGTTFEIYLPAHSGNGAATQISKEVGNVRGGVEKILLVEDEELVRNLLSNILDTCGYKVIEAKDGFEAIEICKKSKQKIDLLLTDVVMPKMNGRELAEKIKDLFPSIKILFTSGYTADAVVRHGISEKEMNFIQKPYSFDELTIKVRSLLDKKNG